MMIMVGSKMSKTEYHLKAMMYPAYDPHPHPPTPTPHPPTPHPTPPPPPPPPTPTPRKGELKSPAT